MAIVRLRLLWYPQAQFAGALLAQHSNIARNHGIQLECQPVRFDEDAISAVLSGSADLCVASPAHMFESSEAESLVFILAFQQISPVVHLAWKDEGIESIDGLAGRRIGVWPDSNDLETRWMLQKSGVSLDSIEFVETTDTLGALLARDVSCAQITSYNEYVQFLEKGCNKDDFLHLYAREFDADLVKDGIVTTKNWLESDPVNAQAVVDCLLEGWTRALDDPEEALRVCAKVRPDIDQRFHQAQLENIRKLVVCKASVSLGLGYPDTLHVQRAAEAVRDVHGRDFSKSTISGSVSNRFWHSAPAQFRRKSWN